MLACWSNAIATLAAFACIASSPLFAQDVISYRDTTINSATDLFIDHLKGSGTTSISQQVKENTINLTESHISYLNIDRYYSVYLSQDTIDLLVISNRKLFEPNKADPDEKNILISNSIIDTYKLRVNTIQDMGLLSVTFGQLVIMDDIKLTGKPEWTDVILPDTLHLLNVDLSQLQEPLNLMSCKPKSESARCQVFFKGVDLSKMLLLYRNFKVYFPKYLKLSFDEKAFQYQQMLTIFEERNSLLNYEALDKDYQEFKYLERGIWGGSVLNWIDKNWWDYGYNKFLVIRGSIIINFIFFLVNLTLFSTLLRDGYTMQKFVSIDQSLKKKYAKRRVIMHLFRIPYVFIYTGYIFWGLKLDIDKVHIHKIWLFSYVLFQYLAGIVCLAYIANLIVNI
jgi:hypothetical protein